MDRFPKVTTFYGSLNAQQQRFDRVSRQSRFAGESREELRNWQKEARHLLGDLIGLSSMESCPLQPQVLELVEAEPGIVREKVLLQTEPDVYMPVYILIPKNMEEKRLPCFLALPGHMGAGKFSVAGCAEYPTVKEAIERFNYDYGLQLARRGYVALCPDCRGFGERRDEALQGSTEDAFLNSTCFHLAHMAEPLGQTVIGMCVHDTIRLIDYVYERDEWDLDQLGCVGFSGGGMQTLYVVALDERVNCAVISGYFYGFKDSLLTLNGNCSCNYVPGLWRHFDCGDIGGLIAPRRLIVQSCIEDDLAGARGLENVREQLQVTKTAYQIEDAQAQVIHDIRPGGHCFHPEVFELL